MIENDGVYEERNVGTGIVPVSTPSMPSMPVVHDHNQLATTKLKKSVKEFVSMFDITRLKDVALKTIDQASREAMNVMPEMFNDDKRVANAYGAMLALLTAADKEYELGEFEDAIQFILTEEWLKEANLVSYTIAAFEKHTTDFRVIFDDRASEYKFPIEAAKKLEEIAKVTDPMQRANIKASIDMLIDGAGNAERDMGRQIKLVLV